ncbi:MAG: lipid IV(A) 3-deoxy-D-manno-octulosonic acid transferase [Cocleimonas sp.]|nr:lipid IV(A) 3-deoxy-D-manno-octulosonic acid transferase [Cocleimonas sp.]
MSLSRFVYTFVLYLLLPLVLLRLLLKSRQNKNYRLRIRERLGWTPKKLLRHNIIWLHAVSVGETIAAKPLIERLLKDYPDHALLVTSTTPTGSEAVKKLFADEVLHSYFPYDLPYMVKRFIARVKPQLLIIVETEIWPNLYAACAHKNIPLLLINARLSKRSTKQYLQIKSLVSETLSHAKVIAVRSEEDYQHFMSLGASIKQLELTGNIKFDIKIGKDKLSQAKQLKTQWGLKRPVWVVASTHANEDEVLLTVFQQLKQHFPTLLLIIVPRHPERFSHVEKLLLAMPYFVQKRSDKMAFERKTDIILGDSMGEMLLWYATANIAFIGGSLVKTGGHNPLEAIAFGVPVISGRYIFNFSDIYPLLCDAQIAWIENSPEAITQRIRKLLASNNLLIEQPSIVMNLSEGNNIHRRCYYFIQSHKGVVDKLSLQIKNYL